MLRAFTTLQELAWSRSITKKFLLKHVLVLIVCAIIVEWFAQHETISHSVRCICISDCDSSLDHIWITWVVRCSLKQYDACVCWCKVWCKRKIRFQDQSSVSQCLLSTLWSEWMVIYIILFEQGEINRLVVSVNLSNYSNVCHTIILFIFYI